MRTPLAAGGWWATGLVGGDRWPVAINDAFLSEFLAAALTSGSAPAPRSLPGAA